MSSLLESILVELSVTCIWMSLRWHRLSWSFFSMWLVFVLFFQFCPMTDEVHSQLRAETKAAGVAFLCYCVNRSILPKGSLFPWGNSDWEVCSHGWGMSAVTFASEPVKGLEIQRLNSKTLLGCRSTKGGMKGVFSRHQHAAGNLIFNQSSYLF